MGSSKKNPDLRCFVSLAANWQIASGDFVRRAVVATTNLPIELASLYEAPGALAPRQVWKHPYGVLLASAPDVVLAATALAASRVEADNYFSEDLKFGGPVPDTLGEDTVGLSQWEAAEQYPECESAEVDAGGGYDVDGVWIPEDMLKAGRDAEMQWLAKQEVFAEVPLKQCWDETGRRPYTLKWVDKVKYHADGTPLCRSRLVVREVKAAKPKSQRLTESEVFASMPPNEALKILMSLFMSGQDAGTNRRVVAVFDVSRAHFYGLSRRRVFVELPEGWRAAGRCGVLLKTMYGTQDAAQVWADTWSEHLAGRDFQIGVANPSLFHGWDNQVHGLCHGDDFVIVSSGPHADAFELMLEEKFEIKQSGRIGFGHHPKDHRGREIERSCSVLNRTLTCEVPANGPAYLSIEADPKHIQSCIEDFNLTKCRRAATPRVKADASRGDLFESPPLPAIEHTQFRSIVMRLAYVAQDRPDLSESIKCLARHMAAPTVEHQETLKRLVRYCSGRPRAELRFHVQKLPPIVQIFVDSDWAGDVQSRRSTTGLVAQMGGHLVRHNSTMQTAIGLSSGEAEYYALCRGAATGLGMCSHLKDFGYEFGLLCMSDSSAARAVASRKGLGRIRHLHTRYLWMQNQVSAGNLRLGTVKGVDNPADILTKAVPGATLDRHLVSMNCHFKP